MDYNATTPSSGIFAAIGLFGGIVYFAFLILVIASMWKLFEKAGKPGWAAIIPIYNLIVMIEIVGKPTIWILWLIIPCVNFVFIVWLTNLFAKSFGKSEGYTVGMFILPFVFYPMLAFGNNPYLGPSAAEARQGGFGPKNFGDDNPFNQPPTTPQA